MLKSLSNPINSTGSSVFFHKWATRQVYYTVEMQAAGLKKIVVLLYIFHKETLEFLCLLRILYLQKHIQNFHLCSFSLPLLKETTNEEGWGLTRSKWVKVGLKPVTLNSVRISDLECGVLILKPLGPHTAFH